MVHPSRGEVNNCAISRRLVEERHRLGLTQAELAKIGMVSKRSQVFYEQGRSPAADYFPAIAGAGVDILYVLTGERRDGLPTPSADRLPPRLRERLAAAIEVIDEVLEATHRTAAPAAKAELVLAAYDILATEGESASAEIIRLVRS